MLRDIKNQNGTKKCIAISEKLTARHVPSLPLQRL